jgi:hypothetical protein
MNALRHRSPPRRPRPRDITAHTRTLAGPGAAATVHISGLLGSSGPARVSSMLGQTDRPTSGSKS